MINNILKYGIQFSIMKGAFCPIDSRIHGFKAPFMNVAFYVIANNELMINSVHHNKLNLVHFEIRQMEDQMFNIQNNFHKKEKNVI